MNAPRDILGAIAADPNVSPAFAAAVRPVGFGKWDNWLVHNPDGLLRTVVFADSAAAALRRAYAPEGCTARVQNYADAMESAAVRRAGDAWGRLG